MPDILIRMEMPRNCFECPLFTNCDACEGYECGCGLLGGIGYEEDISEDRRRDNCPLVELPEHGDLIDRGEIKTNMVDEVLGNKVSYVNMEQIKNAPVVIPSNKEDAE